MVGDTAGTHGVCYQSTDVGGEKGAQNAHECIQVVWEGLLLFSTGFPWVRLTDHVGALREKEPGRLPW